MPGWVCLGAIPSISLATGVLNNSSGLPATGQWPFNLSQGCRRADGLHVPAGQPGVVGQGGGTLRVHSQELNVSSPSPRSGGSCLRAQRRTSPS